MQHQLGSLNQCSPKLWPKTTSGSTILLNPSSSFPIPATNTYLSLLLDELFLLRVNPLSELDKVRERTSSLQPQMYFLFTKMFFLMHYSPLYKMDIFSGTTIRAQWIGIVLAAECFQTPGLKGSSVTPIPPCNKC